MLYQLKYENNLGQSMVFGGVGYHFVDTNTSNTTSSGYRVTKFEGFGDVDADIQRQRAPYQDGNTHIDTVLEERPLFIEFVMSADDFRELSAMRREISRVFNPKIKGKLMITYDGGDYEIECSPEHVPKFADGGTDAVGKAQIGIINLSAPNPYWKSPTVTEEPGFEPLFEFPSDYWEVGGDGDLYFEMGIQRSDRIIVNDGDAPTPIRVVFYGPADKPHIENGTTGEFIRVNKVLKENERLIVDTSDGVKSVIYVDSNGVESNEFNWIDLSSTFFKLQVGENEITCNCAIAGNQKDFDIYYSKLFNAV